MVGMAKTGVPGFGILVVPIIAAIFGGRQGAGALLPMLIVADVFAVAYYRRHTQWEPLRVLAPWVLLGMAGGALFLWRLGLDHGKDWMNPVIGGMVLAMLTVHLLKGRLGDRLRPTSPSGVALTGGLAGFTTLVSNAAGPVMSIYMSALGFAKKEFMGTSAWYFLILNVTKVPVYIVLTLATPDRPLMTGQTLTFNALMVPFIVAGAITGRKVMERLSERVFTDLVLLLAAIAAIRMLFV